jgi:hypothetical protein
LGEDKTGKENEILNPLLGSECDKEVPHITCHQNGFFICNLNGKPKISIKKLRMDKIEMKLNKKENISCSAGARPEPYGSGLASDEKGDPDYWLTGTNFS